MDDAKLKNLIVHGRKIIFPMRWIEWEEALYKKSIGYDILEVAEDALKIMDALYVNIPVHLLADGFNTSDKPDNYKNAVRKLVFNFSSKGHLFWEETNKKIISSEENKEIAHQKEENIQCIIAISKRLIPKEKLEDWEDVLNQYDIDIIEDCVKVMWLILDDASQREVQDFLDKLNVSPENRFKIESLVRRFYSESLGRIEIVLDNNFIKNDVIIINRSERENGKKTRMSV